MTVHDSFKSYMFYFYMEHSFPHVYKITTSLCRLYWEFYFIFIGGFASGSFYIPYTKGKGMELGKLLDCKRDLPPGIPVIPLLAAWLTVPGFRWILSVNGRHCSFLDLLPGRAMGYWWLNVRFIHALPRYVAGDGCGTGLLFRLWRTDTTHLPWAVYQRRQYAGRHVSQQQGIVCVMRRGGVPGGDCHFVGKLVCCERKRNSPVNRKPKASANLISAKDWP